MSNLEPARRSQTPQAWGTRAMRNPRSNVRRYNPNTESILTGKGNDEGEAQALTALDHGSLSGLGDDDHTQYLQKAGGQLTGVVKDALTVSSTDPLTLANTVGAYVFSGTTATWTLPAVSGNTGVAYWIKNRGSGTLTLSRAGADNLYDTTTRTTISIAAGASARILNDGTYWLVLLNA